MKTLSKIIFPLLVLVHIGARLAYSDAISGSAAVEFHFSEYGNTAVSYIPESSFDWKEALHNEPFHQVQQVQQADIYRAGNAHLPFKEINLRTDLYRKGQVLTTAFNNE